MVKTVFLALVLIFSAQSFATTIVIYITGDFVIMATDSRGVFTNAKTYKQDVQVVPKIYKSGSIYFSLAGLTSNPRQGFDVGKMADVQLRNAKDFTAGIASVKAIVKQALLTYLTNQKKINYKLFKKNIEADAYVTSLGFIGIRDSKPYAHLLGYKVVDGDELKITVEEEIYPQSDKDAVYYLGKSSAIDHYMSNIRQNNLEPVAFVEKLIQLQIAKTPQDVGLPIDILKITPKATTWIRKKISTPVELK